MKFKVCFFCFLLFLIFFNFVLSKCPVEFYNVSGKIIDENENPIPEAKIFMFFDDYAYSTIKEKQYCSTNEEGYYECELYYSTYKYSFLFFTGDVCGKKPQKIELVIHHEKYETKRVIVKKLKKYTQKTKISLPKIEIIERGRYKNY